jgi:hypothetical protein
MLHRLSACVASGMSRYPLTRIFKKVPGSGRTDGKKSLNKLALSATNAMYKLPWALSTAVVVLDSVVRTVTGNYQLALKMDASSPATPFALSGTFTSRDIASFFPGKEISLGLIVKGVFALKANNLTAGENSLNRLALRDPDIARVVEHPRFGKDDEERVAGGFISSPSLKWPKISRIMTW